MPQMEKLRLRELKPEWRWGRAGLEPTACVAHSPEQCSLQSPCGGAEGQSGSGQSPPPQWHRACRESGPSRWHQLPIEGAPGPCSAHMTTSTSPQPQRQVCTMPPHQPVLELWGLSTGQAHPLGPQHLQRPRGQPAGPGSPQTGGSRSPGPEDSGVRKMGCGAGTFSFSTSHLTCEPDGRWGSSLFF